MSSRTIQEKVSHFLTGMDISGAFIKYLYLLQKSVLKKYFKILQLNNIAMPEKCGLVGKVQA